MQAIRLVVRHRSRFAYVHRELFELVRSHYERGDRTTKHTTKGAISLWLDAKRIAPLRVTLKPIIDFLLTESQTSHAHHSSYLGDHIPFKTVFTRLAIALYKPYLLVQCRL